MYDKIYKEIFLKDFILKRKVYQFYDSETGEKQNRSIWEVKIYNKSYFLLVYVDDIDSYLTEAEKQENRKEYAPKNEAELAHFAIRTDCDCTTEKRVVANRLFLELIKRFSKEAPYLYRLEKADKRLLNYVL